MTISDYEQLRKSCELFGHDDEYYQPIHGLCFTCKSINPDYED